MSSLAPGRMINSSVRLVRPLGAGGMGSVWIADHLGLHTQVVVKFIADALIADPEAMGRFTREAAAASRVKSPHVVQMLDHGVTADGVPFIAMELLEGQDLGKRLQQVAMLPPAEIAGIVVQAAKALARAHERGVVHRDIKPENIFLCDIGAGEVFVKVLDFGIAKAADTQQLAATRTGAFFGSPYYMSPEQMMASKAIDARTDLWSLGIVVFEALTGHRPFQAETITSLSVAVCTAPLPVPSQANPALGTAFDAWFLRACARNPEARFRDAKELSDAFVAAVAAVPQAGQAPYVPMVASMPPSSHAGGLGSTTHAPIAGQVGMPRSKAPPRRAAAIVAVLMGVGLMGAAAVAFALTHEGRNLAPSAAATEIASPEKTNRKHVAKDEPEAKKLSSKEEPAPTTPSSATVMNETDETTKAPSASAKAPLSPAPSAKPAAPKASATGKSNSASSSAPKKPDPYAE